MALYLEQTLYNADVVRYHRISEFKIDNNSILATAVLSSYRSQGHRGMSGAPVIKREYSFVRSGDFNVIASEAYNAIMSLPEWSGAELV